MRLAIIVLAGMLCGCVETVKTFDGNGKQLGECQAARLWFWGGSGLCTGSANPRDQQEPKIEDLKSKAYMEGYRAAQENQKPK